MGCKNRKKRFIAVLLTAVLIAGTVPLTASAVTLPFKDVDTSAWYSPAVEYVYERGQFQGTAPDAFSPEASMTRAMFVQVLANNTDNFSVPKRALPFQDVEKGSWYYDAVAWAYENCIVNGVSKTEFRPDGKITREQMVTMLYSYAIGIGADTLIENNRWEWYADFDAVSGWAKTPMKWALSTGVINGVSSTLISPKATARRCEVAQILKNAAAILPAGSSMVPADVREDPDIPLLGMLRFTHRDLGAWGATETGEMSADNKSVVYQYKLFPNLDFFLPYADLEETSMPEAIVTELGQVFPLIVNRSLGTASNYLGGNFSYQYIPYSNYPSEGYYEVFYRTENYYYYIYMDEPDRFSTHDMIEIQPRTELTPSVLMGPSHAPEDYLACLGLPLQEAILEYGLKEVYGDLNNRYPEFLGFVSLPGAKYSFKDSILFSQDTDYSYMAAPVSGLRSTVEYVLPEIVGTSYVPYEDPGDDERYEFTFLYEKGDGYEYFIRVKTNAHKTISADTEVSVFKK